MREQIVDKTVFDNIPIHGGSGQNRIRLIFIVIPFPPFVVIQNGSISQTSNISQYEVHDRMLHSFLRHSYLSCHFTSTYLEMDPRRDLLFSADTCSQLTHVLS